MLQFTLPTSHGQAQIVGALAIRPDKADALGVTAAMRLRFLLDTRDDAEAWAGSADVPVFPGLADRMDEVQTEKSDVHFKLGWKRIGGHELLVDVLEAASGVEVHGTAVIKRATAHVSKKACYVDADVTLHGVPCEEVGNLAKCLRVTVDIRTEDKQQEMYPDRMGASAEIAPDASSGLDKAPRVPRVGRRSRGPVARA